MNSNRTKYKAGRQHMHTKLRFVLSSIYYYNKKVKYAYYKMRHPEQPPHAAKKKKWSMGLSINQLQIKNNTQINKMENFKCYQLETVNKTMCHRGLN